jgi:hypothetical protein
MSKPGENDGANSDKGAPLGSDDGRSSGPNGTWGPNAESDILAFFYDDAGSALARLQRDEAELGSLARRLGRFTREAGLDAAAAARREFHEACARAERTSWLTWRLIETIRADLT